MQVWAFIRADQIIFDPVSFQSAAYNSPRQESQNLAAVNDVSCEFTFILNLKVNGGCLVREFLMPAFSINDWQPKNFEKYYFSLTD